MNLHVHRTKVRLSTNILAQIQEATMIDMSYALSEGTILGYINPIREGELRVFLLVAENGDYRKVTNYVWQLLKADPCKIHTTFYKNGSRHDITKPFQSETSKIDFLELVKEVKKIALLTHIYI